MRREKGVTIILLCFVLGLLTLPMLGLFTFECIRAISAREQLRSACEAASLAGAAKLASSDVTNPTQAHNDSLAAAYEAFRANSINGYPLATASAAPNEFYNPSANQGSIYIEFLNPNSNPPNQPVPIGNTNGRIVRVIGAWAHTPAFGDYVGLGGPYVMRAAGFGRVPQMDLVLAFDVSGSIDDQTPVTLVKRWHSNGYNPSRVCYWIATASSSAKTTGDKANGTIYDIEQPPPTGTGANAYHPQHMSSYGNGVSFNSTIRGTPSTGSPGGTYPDKGPPIDNGPSGAGVFTHCVVNINEDPNDHSWPNAGEGDYTSPNGFFYPNVYTALEAHLGNLENATNYNNAKLGNTPEIGGSGVIAQAGYQADFISNAKKKVMPLYAAQDAAVTFFTIMNTNTEAHFGLTCFNDNAGQTPGQTYTGTTWGNNYGGTAGYPKPGVSLHQTQTKFTDCVDAVNLTVANGSTNIGGAIQRGRIWLTDSSKTRPGARKAIVLFTDGQPTAPNGSGPGSGSGSFARTEAQLCKDAGIPIYTIGLAQVPGIIPGEIDTLNDAGAGQTVQYVDQDGQPQSYTCQYDGVSYKAGNGGKFFLVTNTAHLRLTFENIARQLVQLVKVD